MNNWLLTNIDIPAIVFAVILTLGIWVLHKAQASKTNNFDLADMLRDEAGKPSSFRLFGFVSLAASTWGLMYHIVYSKGVVDKWLYLGYAAIWSGSALATKALEVYSNRGKQDA